MPNWTENDVTFVCKTKEGAEHLKLLLESKREKFDFNNIIPMPIELQGTVSGSENSKPDWQIEQSKELIEKYGHDNWYSWSIDKWGTKWNAVESKISQTENVLKYSFDTAWDAPRQIVEKLRELQKTILKNVKIKWKCVHEDGNEREQILT
tara:strand:- start:112 stop:564 length:453 start_codon:yes stop_codon:yes gene_type:complete